MYCYSHLFFFAKSVDQGAKRRREIFFMMCKAYGHLSPQSHTQFLPTVREFRLIAHSHFLMSSDVIELRKRKPFISTIFLSLLKALPLFSIAKTIVLDKYYWIAFLLFWYISGLQERVLSVNKTNNFILSEKKFNNNNNNNNIYWFLLHKYQSRERNFHLRITLTQQNPKILVHIPKVLFTDRS